MGDIAKNVDSETILQNLPCSPLGLEVYDFNNPSDQISFQVNSESQVVVDPSIVFGRRIVVEVQCDNVH